MGERRTRPSGNTTTTTSRRLALLLAVLLTSGSCGSSRSVEAFCDTLISEQERIKAELEQAQQLAGQQDDAMLGALVALGSSIEAIGELRIYTRKLAEVAPAEIQVDAEAVADSVDRQFEAMHNAADNPLGALASSLFEGFATAGASERVDTFARANCGRGI